MSKEPKDRLDPDKGWVRRCGSCKEVQPHSAFSKDKWDLYGIQVRCKKCDRERGKDTYVGKTSTPHQITSPPPSEIKPNGTPKKARVDSVYVKDPTGWLKRCSKCRVLKPFSSFHQNKASSGGLQAQCKECTKSRVRGTRKRTQEHYKKKYGRNRDEIITYVRAHYRTQRGRLLTLISTARTRATKKGLKHDLDIEWALALWTAQGGACCITGIPFELNHPVRTDSKDLNPYSPSLDRIDPQGGYTKDNTRLVCTCVNLALNRFGEDVFRRMLDGYSKKVRT